ncbi:MAG TPA: nucleoside hydrolase [Candidatus Binatia bacterium]|nr:nucleoside hydrolase [Candidatus Binatia bacterium]
MAAPVLIDTDPGIDDALALILALGSPEIAVEAITTVAGNVPVDLGTTNVFRILDVVAPPRRPRVARGAAAPLGRDLMHAAHVHGDDGLGGVDGLAEADGSPRYPAPAMALEAGDGAALILDTAARFPGRLVVIALGPLTNLARAVQRDPARLAEIASVVVMGGAIAVPGNVTPAAEFNMYVDPEAAAVVFRAGLPLRLVPLDVTRQVVLRRGDLDRCLAAGPARIARFVRDFTAHGFAFGAADGDAGIALHDPLAVAAAVDPGALGFDALHVEVEHEGRVTRGLTVADLRPPAPHRPVVPNCEVAMRVDAPRFLRLFLERLCPASASRPSR